MRHTPAVVLSFCAALAVAAAGPAEAREKQSPKKVVAVSNFQVTAQQVSGGSGPWNHAQIGRGMRSMLVEALVKTGKFIVVERGEGLNEIRSEQALKTTGQSRGAGAQTQELMAAQALFRGEITDFTPSQQGAKASAGGFKVGGFDVGNVGVGVNNASIAALVRWFDTSSGQVIESFQSEAKASAVGFDVHAYRGMQMGTDAYTKTPIGRATNEVIQDTVEKIVRAMEKVPFQCKVIRGSATEVYFNVGSDSGIAAGDRYDVFSLGEPLVDPDTGAKLGAPKERLGTVRVASVQPKFSIARFETQPPVPAKQGDVAQEVGTQ
jgi:curli biogenesis system outer membrane secretion channel CsgG